MQRHRSPVLAAIVCGLCWTRAAGIVGAQQSAKSPSVPPPDAVVYVTVLDSTDRPLSDVELRTIAGLNKVLARTRSDAGGRAVLRVQRDSSELQLAARRLGLRPTTRFFRADRDSIQLEIRLSAAPQILATVSVSAEEDLKRKSYFVDADEIANSKRLIENGMDVLTKMKPDILEGRSPGCGVETVYVNGKRVVNPPRDEVALAHMPPGRTARFSSPARPLTARQAVWSIMWSIKAEHIAQMDYKDCLDTSMPGLHASSALYVVLKPGIAYEPGLGSYVVNSDSSVIPDTGVVKRRR